MSEELKIQKTYIEHLERKIKVVVEENKILKSLLLENKKLNNNKGQANLNMSIMNTSMSNFNNTSNQQSNMKILAQITPNNENIPPSCLALQNSSNNQIKQPYFFPVGTATGNIGITQTPTQINFANSNFNSQSISINNSINFQQQNNMSISMKDQPQENCTNKNVSVILTDQNQNSNQFNVFKDHSNKSNIMANVLSETQKAKPNPNNNFIHLDENLIKINNEKLRSLSVDINVKRPTLITDSSINKLDSSLIEPSQCNNKIMGHTKYKNKIPKLNLEILPNYHGNSNKSINQQLLQQYQVTQQKIANKITEKQQ